MSGIASEESVLPGLPPRTRPAVSSSSAISTVSSVSAVPVVSAVHEPRSDVRVFLLDEHPLFRTGVRSAVENTRAIRIVGEAASGKEALDAFREWPGRQPDVILADPPSVGVPMDEFIGITKELLGQRPAPRTLILSMVDSDDAVIEAVRAGAHGFLRKSTGRDELIRAIYTVTCGGAIFGPLIAERLERYFTKICGDRAPDVFPELTSREQEVLVLLAQGHRNRDIARRLFLSEKTVRNHVSHIFAKLQVKDRAAAATRARKAGLRAGPPG